MAKPKSSKPTNKQYEDLGRIVANVYETGYLDAAKSYRMSFIKGMFQGLGGVVGATILVAILIWLLSFFSEVPLLGKFFEVIENTVDSAGK